MLTLLLVILAVAGGLAGVRLLLGPRLTERVIALDIALIALMSGVAANAAFAEERAFLDEVLVVAIVGFLTTASVSRYILYRARQQPRQEHDR